MKKIILLFLLVLNGGVGMLWAASAGDTGIGIVIGDPIGPTLKYWTDSSHAIDFAVEFDDDYTLYADYLWHSWTVFPKPTQGKLGGYVGLGPRFHNVEHDDNEFGLRTVGGVDYWIQNSPIELFFELAPVFQLSPDLDTDLDAGVGIRFYFSHH